MLESTVLLKENVYGLLYLAVTMVHYIRMVFETRCYPFKPFLAKKN
jgi:hypothetical protein